MCICSSYVYMVYEFTNNMIDSRIRSSYVVYVLRICSRYVYMFYVFVLVLRVCSLHLRIALCIHEQSWRNVSGFPQLSGKNREIVESPQRARRTSRNLRNV